MSASGIPELVDGLEDKLRAARKRARGFEQRLKIAQAELVLDAPDMACADCGGPRDDCNHPYFGEPADTWQHDWVAPVPVRVGHPEDGEQA